MTKFLSVRGSLTLGLCLASLFLVAGPQRVSAQEGQGKYITQASKRLTTLIDKANEKGYSLTDNNFSIGGGWLKQSTTKWVPLYTIKLTAGKKYRFIAAGDGDAKDVDLEVIDSDGRTKARDVKTDPEAIVDFTPTETGVYTVRIRLYASREDAPCVCLAVVMAMKK